MSIQARFNLSRWAIEHSRLTISFWLAIAVAGILAFSSLKYSLFPDITFPVVVIRAQSDLETVLETEAQLTKPIETSLASVTGLAQLFSSTYSGQAVINLLLDTNIKIEDATTTVKTTLQQLSLPITDLEVIPFNLNESTAISYVLLSDRRNLSQLAQIATEEITPPLAQLPGVERVDILGNPAAVTNSELSPADYQTLVHFNGQEAIAFEIVKQGDANTLEVVKQVEATVAELQSSMDRDIELVLAETAADYIRQATKATVEALIGAVVLAILVIFPFLRNFKATLIAAIAIPLSLLGTSIVMALAGFDLETLTLLALALVIGIVVDDAIVEVENIMRHIEADQTPHEAALSATREIGLTVSISTLTIVAVFLPIALMGGTLGQFFRPFGLTISAAVLISLLAARTLSPVLAKSWLTSRNINSPAPVRSKITPNSPFHRSYQNLLRWSLNHRRQVIGIAIASFLVGIALIPLIPQGFVPQLDRGEFNVVYTTPLPKLASPKGVETPGISTQPDNTARDSRFSWLKNIARSPESILLRRTISVGKQIETIILDNPNVESVYTIAGVRGEPNKGKLYIKLKSDRDLTTARVQSQVRTSLSQLSQAAISVEDIPFVETGEDPSFKIALEGENLAQLRASAIAFKERTEQLPGFFDVRVSGVDEPLTEIIHLDGKRVAYVNANLTAEQAIGDATTAARAIAESILPPEVSFNLEGDSARARKILGEFAVTLSLAVVCMLVVLYLPFGRWLEPMVIGLSLPLSIVGAMLGLLITQRDFGMISLIGLIFLLGLLDKNAILLLDYANQLRKAGINRTQAILETGVVRLRPIIMTTFSTILGMLPIALGWGAGSELRQPMAVGIIGGLITSSLLSLIVVPVLYTLLEDWRSGKMPTDNEAIRRAQK